MAVHISEDLLNAPARRTARLAALELLGRVRETRDRLEHAHDDDALHDFRVAIRRLRSWLRTFHDVLDDTLPAKPERRLKRVARATSASRDLEVHIAWVEERRKTLRGPRRAGADWLLERLNDRKLSCDAELRRVVDSTMDRVVARIDEAMRCYLTSVVDPEPTFTDVMSDLVRMRAETLEKALGRISTVGDRAEAHAARIEAKRLRYLLEPLDETKPDVRPVIAELTEMQDRLGELHDAQLFGSEIASLVAEVLAQQSNATAGEAGADTVPGLMAMSRSLRKAEERAFAEVERQWLGKKGKKVAQRAVEAIA
ncbi:MAG TPA: CHAD domain-containing protein [Gemmatimonadaceae bacterium]